MHTHMLGSANEQALHDSPMLNMASHSYTRFMFALSKLHKATKTQDFTSFLKGDCFLPLMTPYHLTLKSTPVPISYTEIQ